MFVISVDSACAREMAARLDIESLRSAHRKAAKRKALWHQLLFLALIATPLFILGGLLLLFIGQGAALAMLGLAIFSSFAALGLALWPFRLSERAEHTCDLALHLKQRPRVVRF